MESDKKKIEDIETRALANIKAHINLTGTTATRFDTDSFYESFKVKTITDNDLKNNIVALTKKIADSLKVNSSKANVPKVNTKIPYEKPISKLYDAIGGKSTDVNYFIYKLYFNNKSATIENKLKEIFNFIFSNIKPNIATDIIMRQKAIIDLAKSKNDFVLSIGNATVLTSQNNNNQTEILKGSDIQELTNLYDNMKDFIVYKYNDDTIIETTNYGSDIDKNMFFIDTGSNNVVRLLKDNGTNQVGGSRKLFGILNNGAFFNAFVKSLATNVIFDINGILNTPGSQLPVDIPFVPVLDTKSFFLSLLKDYNRELNRKTDSLVIDQNENGEIEAYRVDKNGQKSKPVVFVNDLSTCKNYGVDGNECKEFVTYCLGDNTGNNDKCLENFKKVKPNDNNFPIDKSEQIYLSYRLLNGLGVKMIYDKDQYGFLYKFSDNLKDLSKEHTNLVNRCITIINDHFKSTKTVKAQNKLSIVPPLRNYDVNALFDKSKFNKSIDVNTLGSFTMRSGLPSFTSPFYINNMGQGMIGGGIVDDNMTIITHYNDILKNSGKKLGSKSEQQIIKLYENYDILIKDFKSIRELLENAVRALAYVGNNTIISDANIRAMKEHLDNKQKELDSNNEIIGKVFKAVYDKARLYVPV